MINLEKVNKWYGAHHVLKDVDLSVARGEVLVVCGPSGSGKSTMIRTINRLEPIEKGRILIDGADIYAKGANLNALRQKIGFVFQQFNLFPHMSVLENVIFAPVNIRKQSRKESVALAKSLLERVGLEHKIDAYPGALSGGQQQRVAIARAIAGTPALLLADEPTGNLDSQMSQGVMEILRELNQGGMTIIMVTHDKELAACAGRSVHIVDGQIVEVTAQAMQALCA